MSKATRAAKGFTLIELLIVIGIIGFLAAAILVAVDPVRRVQEARNAKRWSEVNAILNAMLTKQVDDRAVYDGETTAPIVTDTVAPLTDAQVIVVDDSLVDCTVALGASRPGCDAAGLVFPVTGAKTCVANINDIAPDYIAEVPMDPLGAGANPCADPAGCTLDGDMALGTTASDPSTGYYISRTTGNRIEIGACFPDLTQVIKVKR
ncbi:MAG: type II secretion system protein [Patescibacteria group bacterium]|nr:type II secretion system protein [Patescibacteria group bacterium]